MVSLVYLIPQATRGRNMPGTLPWQTSLMMWITPVLWRHVKAYYDFIVIMLMTTSTHLFSVMCNSALSPDAVLKSLFF